MATRAPRVDSNVFGEELTPNSLGGCPVASTSQTTSTTSDAASSFVASREYLLKPLEKVYYAVARPCPWSVLVSFHHTSGKLRALDPPLARSADNNVLLTPPSSRGLYPLNSLFLNNSSPCSAASFFHTRRASSS